MLFAVMAEIATLTERLQITGPIVAGVMIKMRRRQHDLHLFERCIVLIGWPIDVLAAVIPPEFVKRIKPTAITEMMDRLTMRPATLLATTASTIKTHRRAKLGPVDRIETGRWSKGAEIPDNPNGVDATVSAASADYVT